MRQRTPVLGLLALGAVLALAPWLGRTAERQDPAARDKSKGEEEQIKAREDWFIQSRGLDQVKRPGRLRARAAQELREAQEARRPELEAAGETWQSVGPITMTMLNWSMGRVTGRVSALAVHAGDENVLYLGAASGGLWKTTDGGSNWTPIFDTVGTLTVGAVAIDGSNANTVWVGTGEQGQSCTSYFGQGLFRSTDAGATFAARNGSGSSALALSHVYSIAIHPTNSQTLLVGGAGPCQSDGTRLSGGVFRTTDGGATWTRVLTGTGSDVVYNPSNPSVVYAAMNSSGVYKSTDGGATWVSASSGLSSSPGRLRLTMAPSNSQVLYALSSNSTLYRTTNGATSWTAMNTSACEGQCTYNLTVDVHPTDSNTILVGTIRPARSTNGGTSLSILTSGWGSAQQVHQDTHVVRFSRSNGSRFWIGSDGGVWRSDNSGGSFVNLNTNLDLTQFYDVAVHPDDPNKIFGGAQDNSSSGRFGNQQWNVTLVTGDGFMNLVDPGTPDRVFQTSYPSGGRPSIYRSTSGGGPNSYSGLATNGIVSGEPFPWVTPLAVVSGTAFVGSHSVYRAATGQSASSFTWTKISGSLTGDTTKAISVISPYPSGSSVVAYVGTSTGRIHRTSNALASSVSWTDVTGNYPGGYVSDVAADPQNLQRVFVTRGAFGSSRLYRSTSGGTTWAAVGSGLPNVPANAVAIDPSSPNRVFVGTDVGVYESADGGDSFAPFSAGLPLGLVVTDLEIDDNPHVLLAGTYGRGAYRVSLSGTTNQPPTANFTFTTSGLTATFQDASTDSDGTIASRNWSFGDGTTSTATNPSRTYTTGGTYQVTLTVTDDDGASGSVTKQVVVSDGGCAGTTYTGTLSSQGSTQIQPNGTYYYSAAAGQHVGCLTGPANTDFDLYLDRWNGSSWAQVAKSDSPESSEKITYSGTVGYYRWRIKSYSGTGSYTFQLQKP